MPYGLRTPPHQRSTWINQGQGELRHLCAKGSRVDHRPPSHPRHLLHLRAAMHEADLLGKSDFLGQMQEEIPRNVAISRYM